MIKISSSVWYYKPRPREDRLLRMRMREVASVRIRYGFNESILYLEEKGLKIIISVCIGSIKKKD